MKHRYLLTMLILVSVVRLILANMRMLTADEAYYLAAVRCAERFWPISDHPPMLGVFLSITDRLSWLTIELRVRLISVLLSAGTSWLIGATAAALVPEKKRSLVMFATVWCSTFALFPMTGSLICTPDSPLLFSLALLMWFEATSLTLSSDKRVRKPWLLFFACLIAILSKVSSLIYLLTFAYVYRSNKVVLQTVLLAALCALPWFGLSLLSQSVRVTGHGNMISAPYLGPIPSMAALASAQFVLWGPALFLLFFKYRGEGILSKLPATHWSAFNLVSLVTLSALVSGRPPEPNWLAPAGLSLLTIAAVTMSQVSKRLRFLTSITVAAPTLLALLLWWNPHIVQVNSLHQLLERSPHKQLNLRIKNTQPFPEGPYAAPARQCIHEGRCEALHQQFHQR